MISFKSYFKISGSKMPSAQNKEYLFYTAEVHSIFHENNNETEFKL